MLVINTSPELLEEFEATTILLKFVSINASPAQSLWLSPLDPPELYWFSQIKTPVEDTLPIKKEL